MFGEKGQSSSVRSPIHRFPSIVDKIAPFSCRLAMVINPSCCAYALQRRTHECLLDDPLVSTRHTRRTESPVHAPHLSTRRMKSDILLTPELRVLDLDWGNALTASATTPLIGAAGGIPISAS